MEAMNPYISSLVLVINNGESYVTNSTRLKQPRTPVYTASSILLNVEEDNVRT